MRRFEMSNDFTFGPDLSISSCPFRVDIRSIWPARPLRSSPITGPSPLLRAVPPLCPAPVLCRSRCPPLAVLPLAARKALPGRRHQGDRFSCSMPAPATSSRHLYTGHRQGSTQATPWLRAHARKRTPLSREFCAPPVSMPSFRLSMRQQWFTRVRLLAAHLTR